MSKKKKKKKWINTDNIEILSNDETGNLETSFFLKKDIMKVIVITLFFITIYIVIVIIDKNTDSISNLATSVSKLFIR